MHDHGNHTDHTRTLLVDVGTGTGRDGLWFARRGLHVLGLDFSPVAVEVAARKAAQHGLSARFEQFDLYDEPAVLERAAGIAAAGPEPSIYARFLLHALEDAGRHNFWAFAKAAGGRTCCEFRTGKDATAVHVFGSTSGASSTRPSCWTRSRRWTARSSTARRATAWRRQGRGPTRLPRGRPVVLTTSDRTPSNDYRVDDEGVHLPDAGGADDAVVDVLLEGRRIWSFNADRDRRKDGVVPWPPALREHLNGLATWSLWRTGPSASWPAASPCSATARGPSASPTPTAGRSPSPRAATCW